MKNLIPVLICCMSFMICRGKESNHFTFVDSLPMGLKLGETDSRELLELGFTADSSILREYQTIIYRYKEELIAYFTTGEQYIHGVKIWEVPTHWQQYGIYSGTTESALIQELELRKITFKTERYKFAKYVHVVYKNLEFSFEFPRYEYYTHEKHPIIPGVLHEVYISSYSAKNRKTEKSQAEF